MYQKSTFDSLVSGLTADERLEMLRGIEESGTGIEEPIFADAEDTATINIEAVYNRLGVVKRILLFFKALFTQRDVMDLLEDSLLRGYAEEVERACRGMFTSGSNTLNLLFKEEFEALRDSLVCFIDPLSRALGPEKKDFISFLAGFEIPLHQEKLIEITDPDNHANDTKTDFDLRRELEGELSDALKEISDSDRSEIYRYVRSLFFLNELVFYPFSNILINFGDDQNSPGVPLDNIKESLLEFGDVLISQTTPPSEIALKALFLFDPAYSGESDRGAIESSLKDRLAGAHTGIEKIRRFCGLVPYRKLLKVISGNIGYTPESVAGGEDWFALYRKFWEERLESGISEYSFENHRRRLLKNACELIHMSELPSLKAYTLNSIDEGFRVQYETTIAFIYQFIDKLFMREMHRVLKIIHVDGDFYKSQNRQEYSDSCEGVRNAHQMIDKLESGLSSGGETRSEIESVKGQMIKQSLRFNQLRGVLEAVDAKAVKIIEEFRENVGLFISIIKGILYGESGGRFDTLSNLTYIGGSENAILMEHLSRSLKQAEEGQRIINELYDLERSVSN
jgi:hypothetical protein